MSARAVSHVQQIADLQKELANKNRILEIEAALERVREVAMAMHKAGDVLNICDAMYQELMRLGISELRNTMINIHNDADETFLNYDFSTYAGRSVTHYGYHIHPMIENLVMRSRSGKDAFVEIIFSGEELNEWKTFRQRSGEKDDDRLSEVTNLHYYFYSIGIGSIGISTFDAIGQEKLDLLKRFKNVFQLAYQRFSDLTLAEAQARQALVDSTLDRVRAEIASMRHADDLERITPLIWKELKVLNIPFLRCGVFIMDEQAAMIHSFLSNPDGKAIASFHLPYGATSLSAAIPFWRKKESYYTHWNTEHYAHFADAVIAQGTPLSKEEYLNAVPEEGIHLHFFPFLQGMLYVGNTEKLSDENQKLTQAVADTFSTAYARYEDFNSLEEAKRQIEKTLTDLQAAQKQLVQSEKMASLGQLTAGIAHEIQNPLNFVNNFSELSADLLEEIKTEWQAGNPSEALALLHDLQQNLEKINHHGKRAGEIVKGMLQHSRTSTGIKEPTDVNILVDEYFRLAYHGLRAKDKSFNAAMKTEYGQNLPPITVVAQDIGRIVLNLITNAFYAVNEKAKQRKENHAAYEPTVWITTRAVGPTEGLPEAIEVAVTDNGMGIPEKIKDKIFQPFFTTKPTGQGTGLGLSLSYDIVQAHGGELRVESKENEGTVFIVKIPT